MKLGNDETAYIHLTNARYLRFGWAAEEPEDDKAFSVIEYNLYTPDGNKLLSQGKIDIYDPDPNIFELVQTILVYIGYRDEQSTPILYMPMEESDFHAAVAAA